MWLEKINSPVDTVKVPLEKLPQLAEEVRQRMIEVVSQTGGHLASSLGVVELTLALHYCLKLPQDKIVWDVGHQSYAHKILTGRNKEFSTLRTYGGLSGFPCKDESPYDTFTTGHSSTAVSLALGLVCARDVSKTAGAQKVVAVIGDGSLSGGLCFEGLNNAGHLKKDILVILNTNELSIAPNAGALSIYLNKLISLPIYNRFKASLEGLAQARLPKGSRLVKIANKFEESLKGLFIPGMLFEELGFRYFGPLDGHNLPLLISTLRNILAIKGPLLLHVVTKKGKGYLPAEKEPVRFHSAGPFERETGRALAGPKPKAPTYTEVISRKLPELAAGDNRIVAITAAMPEGTGLDKFRDTYPQRFYDVGIAEAHAVCFAAGLARQGIKPVVAIYSTFLQRAYDQIMEAVALQDVPVVFLVDRAGIVGEDGFTHQGIFDIAYLSSIPNLALMAPKDAVELEMMLEFALSLNIPAAIRYPKAFSPEGINQHAPLELGKAQLLREGKDFLLSALGSMVVPALEAVDLLATRGIRGTLLNARFACPLDGEFIKKLSGQHRHIFTVEEGVVPGGFGANFALAAGKSTISLGLPCEFIIHGRRDIILAKYGLTAEAIAERITHTVNSSMQTIRG